MQAAHLIKKRFCCHGAWQEQEKERAGEGAVAGGASSAKRRKKARKVSAQILGSEAISKLASN